MNRRSFFLVLGPVMAVVLTATPASAGGGKPPPMPALTLPALPALPNVAIPKLGAPGALSPEVSSWSKYFSKKAADAIAGGSISLGLSSQSAQFAQMWAQAEQQVKGASTALPAASLPSVSQLQGGAPGLSGSDVTALPAMAPPTLVIPPPPAAVGNLSGAWTAAFGAAPSLSSQGDLQSMIPSDGAYTTLEVNPYYANQSSALGANYARSIGCGANNSLPAGVAGPVSCTFLATPSELSGAVASLTPANTSQSRLQYLDSELSALKSDGMNAPYGTGPLGQVEKATLSHTSTNGTPTGTNAQVIQSQSQWYCGWLLRC